MVPDHPFLKTDRGEEIDCSFRLIDPSIMSNSMEFNPSSSGVGSVSER